MRQNKPFTIIPWKKQEEPVLKLHCKFDRGSEMVRLPDGSLRCPLCGGVKVATRTKFTFMKEPSQSQASGVQ
jgi:hypothetical protein